MAESSKEKTLEMRVAELEDKLASMNVTEEEMKAFQKVSALMGGGGGQTSLTPVPGSCVISQCTIRPCTVVHQCTIVNPCTIVSQCIRPTIINQCINQCINECGGGAPGGGIPGAGFGTLGG